MRAYWLMLFGVLGYAASAPGRTEQPYDHCDQNGAALAAIPSGNGPVRLLGIDCPPGGNQSVSPDGKRSFGRRYPEGQKRRGPAVLVVGGMEKGGETVTYPLDPSFETFTFSKHTIFHWASDYRSIWGGEQKSAPGGFAAEPLRPVLLLPDGTIKSLPALEGPGGPLDGLLWIGGDGLALAQFGTRGGYYRPEHPDPEPTMAFVDAKRGKYLDWFAFKKFPRAVSAQGQPMVPLQIASVLLPNGRPRVLLQWPSGYSLLWTQGSEPREVSLPEVPWGATIEITPDGERLLISYHLSAAGAICETYDDEPDTCPPPKAVTGKLAELIDIESGRTIWDVRETATRFESHASPIISPNGRYALVSFPQNESFKRGSWLIYGRIALVSMSDGKVLQTMPSFSEGYSMSFGEGARFYIGSVGYLATYEIVEP